VNTCDLCSTRFGGSRCPMCGTSRETELAETGSTESLELVRTQSVSRVVPNEVHGVVVQTKGPAASPPSPNYWRRITILVAVLFLLPIVLFLWLVVSAVKTAFFVCGLSRGGRGGKSLWDELVMFHLFGAMMRPKEPIPVYHHVVQGASGRCLVRQEGEFREGCIFVGNTVRLNCASRGSSRLVRHGYNETLSAHIAGRSNPWKTAFFVVLITAICFYAAILG
jgi:hypothetical protein